MYNQPKILKDLYEARAEIDKSIGIIEGQTKDLNRFYKKGFKASGARVRKILKVVMTDIVSLRADISRMTKERIVFKDTEYENDFK